MNSNDLTSSICERIKKVIYESRTSENALATELEMKQVTINRQLKGANALSCEIVAKLLCSRKDLSAEWLMRGKGNMMNYGSVSQSIGNGNINASNVNNSDKVIETLNAQLVEKDRQIARLLDLLSK